MFGEKVGRGLHYKTEWRELSKRIVWIWINKLMDR